ncbi:MAG TPA: hypothetical protein VHY91_05605 [Pirellulales bacterium]|jgi:hypothetical protein|nr:hypothetical protein [Pirellulales bacterium]
MAWKNVTAVLLVLLGGMSGLSAATSETELSTVLASIKQVGTKGAGHRAAQTAWQKLADADASQLPAILIALDDASPLAANWLRSAAEAIVARQLAAGAPLPKSALEGFLLDRRHAPRSRRLAYEWLVRVDGATADRLLGGMLDDPSLELRRDAVAQLIERAQAKVGSDPSGAKAVFTDALNHARDLDQIRAAIGKLNDLGVKIDLARQLGFIMRWKVIGPFDNSGGRGFAKAFLPEQAIDLAAKYEGKVGSAKWLDAEASDELGHIDLNQALGTHKGAVAYAYAEFNSPREQPVELRLGSANANKIWLNGKLLADFEVYHSFTTLDQYVGRGSLKRGTNRILLKLCQNEQTEEWAAEWKFQLRVCDPTGGALKEQEKSP